MQLCDMVLVMSVYPGFGGQKYIAAADEKLRRLAKEIAEKKPGTLLEVDGGVTEENAARLIELGADVIVAGSAVFRAADRKAAIAKLRGGAGVSL